MLFDPLLGDYNDVLSKNFTNFAFENTIHSHDNRKKIRTKRTVGRCKC